MRQRASDADVIYVDPRRRRPNRPLCRVGWIRHARSVVAVYVVPSAARTRTVARGQKNSSSLPIQQPALLNAILVSSKRKDRRFGHGEPVSHGRLPNHPDLHLHLLERDAFPEVRQPALCSEKSSVRPHASKHPHGSSEPGGSNLKPGKGQPASGVLNPHRSFLERPGRPTQRGSRCLLHGNGIESN